MKLIYEIGIGESREKAVKMTEVEDISHLEETAKNGGRCIDRKVHGVVRTVARLHTKVLLEVFRKEKIPVAYVDVRMTSDGMEVYRYDA